MKNSQTETTKRIYTNTCYHAGTVWMSLAAGYLSLCPAAAVWLQPVSQNPPSSHKLDSALQYLQYLQLILQH